MKINIYSDFFHLYTVSYQRRNRCTAQIQLTFKTINCACVVYVCRPVRVCAHVYDSHRSISSSSSFVHHLSLATEPRAHQLVSELQGSSGFCLPSTRITGTCHCAQLFYMGADNLNSVLKLAWQVC